MEYRIIITQNNKKKKVLSVGYDLRNIKKKYFKIKDNNKVLFPKKNSTYKKLHPINHEILLIKEWEKDDLPYSGRDNMGKNISISDKQNNWTILHKDLYEIEEKFTVYNYKKRLSVIEIIKYILLKPHQNIIVKQINYINNKLLIHQNNDFDVILCKCSDDCERLYVTLKDFIDNNPTPNILFTGKIMKNKNSIYKMIMDKTKWGKDKIYRTVTRP